MGAMHLTVKHTYLRSQRSETMTLLIAVSHI